jgi:hypothetical protein
MPNDNNQDQNKPSDSPQDAPSVQATDDSQFTSTTIGGDENASQNPWDTNLLTDSASPAVSDTQNVETPPPPILQTEETDENAPVLDIPPKTDGNGQMSGGPKKNRSKTAAAIIGVAFLVAAIPIGVYLLSQEQEIREKASGLPYPPIGYQCKNGGTFQGKCKLIYCPNGCGSDNKCEPSDPGAYYSGTVTCSSFNFGTNVCGQIDIVNNDSPPGYCARQVGDESKYTDAKVSCSSNCSSTPPKEDNPTPTPTPTTVPRPDICGSLTISPAQIGTGATTKFTATTKSGSMADGYWFMLYNKDNPNPDDNVVCVSPGTGDATWTNDDCPANTVPYGFKDPNTANRASGSVTRNYSQLNITDLNFNNSKLKNIQVNAYLTQGGGPFSVAQPACAKPLTLTTAGTPTATPLVTPTPTPKVATPTPTPKVTVTPTPAPGTAQCLDIRAYKVKGDLGSASSWLPLTLDQLNNLQPGEKVYFTVRGLNSQDETDNFIDKARFRINTTTWTVSTLKKPAGNQLQSLNASAIEFYNSANGYTIPTGTTNFKVEAQIHYTGTNAWY